MRTRILLALILAACACIGATQAADQVVVYPANSIGELDSATGAGNSSLAHSSYSTTVFQVGNKQNVTVAGSFSVASANAVVGICRGKMVGGTFKPYRWGALNFLTITADGTFTIDGTRYGSSAAAFDTANCEACFVFVKSVSSGNVIVGWSLH